MSETILVTGGAGFIGSHMTYGLLDRGDKVVVLDDLSTGVRSLVSADAEFVAGNIADITLVRDILRTRKVDAVVHFAGSVIVPESVANPLLYYCNNTSATRNLIEACIAEKVGRFVFSSSAAVYGLPDVPLVSETYVPAPISPYGRSKLMSEWMLQDAARAHDFRFIALRYFNVAGADRKGRTGQSTPRATHLIKRACQVAHGVYPHLDIFGTDYATPDGTGVRDYIHVGDLVAAHLLALDALSAGHASDVFNCGYGKGVSVREIVAAVERAAGAKVAIREAPRRDGDCAIVVADSTKLQTQLAWTARYADIDTIVGDAWAWERRINV